MISESHRKAEADKAKAKAEQQADKVISDPADETLVPDIGGQFNS